MPIEVDDRLAEYDRDLPHYIPIEQIAQENPQELQRLIDGHLPSGVDEEAFRARITAGIDDLVAAADHDDTVAVFSHGGVINVLLHAILGTERLLSFHVDYASVTRLLSSRSGRLSVASVNGTEHVWDLLPRNQRELRETSPSDRQVPLTSRAWIWPHWTGICARPGCRATATCAPNWCPAAGRT